MDREQRKLMRVRGAGSRPLSSLHTPVLKFPSPKKQRTSPIRSRLRSRSRSRSNSPKRNIEPFKVPRLQTKQNKAHDGESVRKATERSNQFLETTPLRQTNAFQMTPVVLNSAEKRELEEISMDFQDDYDRVPLASTIDDDYESDPPILNRRSTKRKVRNENLVSPIRKRRTKNAAIETDEKIKQRKQPEPKRKTVSKPGKISNTRQRLPPVSPKKSFEEEYVYESESEDSGNTSEESITRNQSDDAEEEYIEDNESDESDPDDVLYGKHKKNTIKISRIPTSSSRLTFIDVLIHYLKESVPKYKHYEKDPELFRKFTNNVVMELEEILDLTLANNEHLSELRNIKADKNELRREILEITNQSNQLTNDIKQLRAEYRVLNRNKNRLEDIDNHIHALRRKHGVNDDNDPDSSDETDTVESQGRIELIMAVNKLNKVIDPNYGLLEKLKRVNKKLQTIEQLVDGAKV